MKKILLAFLIVANGYGAFAQTVSSTATSEFMVNGIKVIYKPTIKEVVSVNVYFRGGLANQTEANAGIENLTLAALTECGTKKYNKDLFKDMADEYGIEMGGSSGYDYGVVSLNCISKYFTEGWNLFADAIANPVFDERELGMLKEKIVNSIQTGESDPDTKIESMAISNAFPGTAYGSAPEGTVEKVMSFTRQQVMDYYQKLLNKEAMYIVVVGKISKDDLQKKIAATWAALPGRPYKAPNLMAAPTFTANKTFISPMPLATNYIIGALNAPEMSSADYLPHKLAVTALSGRLFTEIRSNRNLSYAPYANTRQLRMPITQMYVSTTDAKTSVKVMREELESLTKEGFTAFELVGSISKFITSNYMRDESSGAIASSLGNAEIYSGWRTADRMAQDVKNVTLPQMNNAIKKYSNGIYWNFLGNQADADKAMAEFNQPLKK